MHLIFLVLSLHAGLFSNTLYQSESADSITSAPPIEEVTVYLQGAQVTHRTAVNIPEGQHTLVFTRLNEAINSRSATVGFDGEIEVLSVNHRTQQINNTENTETIDRLLDERAGIENHIKELQIDLDVNSYEQNMLRENVRPVDSDAESLKQLLRLHRERMRSLQADNGMLSDSLNVLRTRLNEINQTLRQPGYQPKITVGELVLKIRATQPVSAETQLSYPIDDAGWLPEYDLHVDAADEPIRGKLSASVYNNSRQLWNSVSLTLSTQTPQSGIDIPEISPWFLDYVSQRYPAGATGSALTESTQISGTITDAQSGEPLPGATVRVQEKQAGTTAGRNGRYSLLAPAGSRQLLVTYVGFRPATVPIYGSEVDVRLEQEMMALDEVVVSGYAESDRAIKAVSPSSKRTEQMASREFAIRDLQTIPSDGDVHRITIEENSVESDLSYLTVPKIDTDAVLKADIDDWESLFPLPGTAMLHLEGTYVGQTYIDPATVSDTLQVSFGKDDAIVVSRIKQSDESDKSFFGNRVTRTVSHEISVRNTKSAVTDLQILDQVPVSMRDEIEVSVLDLSGGVLNEETGMVTWKIQIAPGKTRSIVISYEVKHPSGRSVYLD